MASDSYIYLQTIVRVIKSERGFQVIISHFVKGIDILIWLLRNGGDIYEELWALKYGFRRTAGVKQSIARLLIDQDVEGVGACPATPEYI